MKNPYLCPECVFGGRGMCLWGGVGGWEGDWGNVLMVVYGIWWWWIMLLYYYTCIAHMYYSTCTVHSITYTRHTTTIHKHPPTHPTHTGEFAGLRIPPIGLTPSGGVAYVVQHGLLTSSTWGRHGRGRRAVEYGPVGLTLTLGDEAVRAAVKKLRKVWGGVHNSTRVGGIACVYCMYNAYCV